MSTPDHFEIHIEHHGVGEVLGFQLQLVCIVVLKEQRLDLWDVQVSHLVCPTVAVACDVVLAVCGFVFACDHFVSLCYSLCA